MPLRNRKRNAVTYRVSVESTTAAVPIYILESVKHNPLNRFRTDPTDKVRTRDRTPNEFYDIRN